MAYTNLGNILKDLGKLKEAELSQTKAIQLKPNFAEAYFNLVLILKDLDKLQEAEISTRKAIELKPENALFYSNLGTILQDLHKLMEAEQSMRKAIRIKPNFVEANNNLGLILKGLESLKLVLNHENIVIDMEIVSYLKEINNSLWEIEDRIRIKERKQQFDEEFIQLARSVYKENDKRASIKKEINCKYNSKFVEEKSYEDYSVKLN